MSIVPDPVDPSGPAIISDEHGTRLAPALTFVQPANPAAPRISDLRDGNVIGWIDPLMQ